jgi:hypothetical protein
VGGLRGIVKVISCSQRKLTASIMGHGSAINELKFHPVSANSVLVRLMSNIMLSLMIR